MHGMCLYIKRFINIYNNEASIKRVYDGYNLAYEYDMICDVIIHNVNDM